jgi:nucleotide-binding universal stress UspA family protein
METEHNNAGNADAFITDLKHVLVPVDFSEAGISAAKHARLLARLTGAHITLLHVKRNAAKANGDIRSAFNERDWSDKPHSGAAVAQRLDAILDGLQVRRIVLSGDPAGTIAEYVEGASVDLVIMPTRGLGRVRRFLLGSTTAKVLHDVHCPVWTGVTGSAPEHLEDEPQLRQVACAIDFGPASGGIRWAGAFAQALRASLTILHASPQLEPVIGVVHEPEWCAHLASLLRREVEKLITDAGVEADIRLAGGEPAKTVTAMAAELNSDVLVIGRPVENRFLGRLRTHSYAIIRQSPGHKRLTNQTGPGNVQELENSLRGLSSYFKCKSPRPLEELRAAAREPTEGC